MTELVTCWGCKVSGVGIYLAVNEVENSKTDMFLQDTLSERVNLFALGGEVSLCAGGVPAPERFIATRLTAEVTQLRLLAVLDANEFGVEVRDPAFDAGVAACEFDATVEDMK